MSIHVYPVTRTELVCEDYQVTVNGRTLVTDAARVSAIPFNRRWPGHQRSMDQTEIVNFVSFAADEPVTVEVTLPEPSEKVVVRPRRLGITPEITSDGKVRFTMEKPSYCTVEPYGRQRALHIFADPLPEYAGEDRHGEKTLYFGKGIHDAGQIDLHDGETLFIDEGAVVYGIVRAKDADNIRVLGRGILDASRHKETILYEVNAEGNDMAVNNAKRTVTVQFEYCRNVMVEGITIRDSLTYNIRPVACENVHIENVKLIGNWRYNSDGIDMHNCVNVVIRRCFIRTYDDSVCVKGFDCYYDGDVEEAVREAMNHGGRCYDIFRNVLVTDCVIWNDWGKCLEIGAETRAEEIAGVCFEKCDVIHVTGPVLDCDNVDYADVHDIVYRDIVVEYDEVIPCPMLQRSDAQPYTTGRDFAPPLMEVDVTYHPEYSAGGTRRGVNHDITFENIRLYGRQKPILTVTGYDGTHRSSGIRVKDLSVNGERVTDLAQLECRLNEFASDISLI